MYEYAGGVKVLIPFLILLAAFAQLKTYSDYLVQTWSNQGSSEQQAQYLYYTSQVFAIVLLTSVFIGLIQVFNCEMQIKTSTTFFNMMLDRMMRAPVNLYFDVTPPSRIVGCFVRELYGL